MRRQNTRTYVCKRCVFRWDCQNMYLHVKSKPEKNNLAIKINEICAFQARVRNLKASGALVLAKHGKKI